jgi:hypothetical protein
MQDQIPLILSHREKILFGGILIVVCVFVPLSLGFQCIARNTTIPKVPIYPTSTLLANEMIEDSNAYGIYKLTYQSTDSQDAIKDFYADQGCEGWSYLGGRIKCDGGNAKPFGGYAVSFDPNSPSDAIIFTISVAWDKCPGDFDHRTIGD